MSAVINELKQFALMEANQMKSELPSVYASDIDAAYERAKHLDEIICPRCWVKNGEREKLNVVGGGKDTDIYSCKKCGFEKGLSKQA